MRQELTEDVVVGVTSIGVVGSMRGLTRVCHEQRFHHFTGHCD